MNEVTRDSAKPLHVRVRPNEYKELSQAVASLFSDERRNGIAFQASLEFSHYEDDGTEQTYIQKYPIRISVGYRLLLLMIFVFFLILSR
jgi:hypothetical protein